jgi:hypothetical protein
MEPFARAVRKSPGLIDRSILVAVIFTGMYLYDWVRGGYRAERIGEHTVV